MNTLRSAGCRGSRPPSTLRAAAALATLLLVSPIALGLDGDPGGQEPTAGDPGQPTAQGLTPAPPPSGIRPSRAAAERQRQPRIESRTPPRRATASALDLAMTLEVRGMEEAVADVALLAAVETIRELEALVDPRGSALDGLAALNAAAGDEALVLDPRLVEMLQRAVNFCSWSRGAHGPLGGELYALWGLRQPVAARPTPARLRQAAPYAACDRLRLDPASGRVALAAGSQVDPWGFATGWLVDEAMETLLDHGAEDAFVELGWVRRATGSQTRQEVVGPLAAYRAEDAERGWPVALPQFPGQDEALATVWLRDEAISVASASHRPLIVAGDRYAPWIDQRQGTPARGVAAAVAVTERAMDAQALAASMVILGNREGMARAGGLKPTPAILWLLGSGQGKPVLSNYNWSEVALR